jgi:uncharacterized membrane protein YozB (DUF420 family)
MIKNIVRNNITTTSIGIFIILFFLIYFLKPSFLFEKDGSIRSFGIGNYKKTIVPIWLFSIILAILCYLAVLFYLRS